ncbi:hypothetical protein GCM10025875_13450 [Litorihabitans aurantiacus]|uniref:Uncharacterized protein n=1 Tax=Litorihabitans aurantiacus TaxID=1930061 RepID=A0AA37UI61_9MICO|nr:hypothetical protein GCM10025875_13450 [Litorihabitans aurantiacus]
MPSDTEAGREQPLEHRHALAERFVQEVAAAGVQHVEDDERQRRAHPRRRRVRAARGARGDDLERQRAAVLAQPHHLAVEHQRPLGQRTDLLDDIGQSVGDLVQAAGPDAHDVLAVLGAPAVDLHPDAVDLDVDDGRQPRLRGRRLGVRRRRGEHRLDGDTQVQPDGLERRRSTRGRERGGARRRPQEHGGPLHRGERHVERGRGRVLDQCGRGALAKLPVDECGEEPLLVRGGPREQVRDRLGPARGRPLAQLGTDALEPGVDVGDLEGGLRRGRRELVQTRRAYPGAPLPQSAGEVGRHQRELRRVGLAQQLRQERTLGQARPRRGDGGRGPDEDLQQHAPIVPPTPDISIEQRSVTRA